jgi:HD superfamily phosphohydrolase
MFEKRFVKSEEWHHENLSCLILKKIMANKNFLTEDEITRVCHMITGSCPKTDKHRIFLYQIVHNTRCEIDVDKFDYLQRDSYAVGHSLGANCERIMKTAYISDEGNIVFPQKECYNLVQLFSARYGLHKLIYTHPKAEAYQLMIGDIMESYEKEADNIHKYLSTPPTLEALEWYIGLTDCILREIEKTPSPPKEIAMIRNRLHYKLVEEFLVETPRALTSSEVDETRITSFADELKKLCKNKAHVVVVKRNWCKGKANPLDSAFIERISTAAMDSLLPITFQEVVVRVFVKDRLDMQYLTKLLDNFLRTDIPTRAWVVDATLDRKSSYSPGNPKTILFREIANQ